MAWPKSSLASYPTVVHRKPAWKSIAHNDTYQSPIPRVFENFSNDIVMESLKNINSYLVNLFTLLQKKFNGSSKV